MKWFTISDKNERVFKISYHYVFYYDLILELQAVQIECSTGNVFIDYWFNTTINNCLVISCLSV
jgi:hypothetical protein